MRILFLSPRQCWPPVSGAKLREYHLARALGHKGRLTHLAFSEPGLATPTPADLPFCEKLLMLPRPKPYTPGKIARGLFGRDPLPLLNYTSGEMRAAFEGELRAQDFDIVHIDSSTTMASYTRGLSQRDPRQRVVYNWHNIESEVMRRYSENVGSLPRKLYASITAARLERVELTMLEEAFGHIVCSEREREQLLRLAPRARIEVIENGVDTAHFAEGPHGRGKRNRVIFVGTMSYYPNIEAALDFVRHIWPQLSKDLPELRLSLVGSNPTPEVLALADNETVEVTGTVPDVRPYYSDALVAVVPLRTGGGTRLKILEAMAAGVPVVSSTLGAEGLAATPGSDILIAESPDQWRSAIRSLQSDERLWNDLSAAGLELVKSRYDWQGLGGGLFEMYSRWLNGS